MGKRHKKSKLEKQQVIAWKWYQVWRKTGSIAPAFDGEHIIVSRIGWEHLLDSRKHRTSIEKIQRLQALPLAKKLIETSTTYQEFRKEHGISFWAFIAVMDGKKIKVIVSAKKKTKCFLSVIVFR